MTDVVITETMDSSAVDALAEHFEVTYDPSLVHDRQSLLRALADARAIIVRNRTVVDQNLLDAGPDLQVVGRLGVGLDNIDLPACESAGVVVCPATGANADAVAEYVTIAVMMLWRGAFTSSGLLSAGAWPRQELTGREIAGRRLGLVGLGDIARRVASRLRAMGMEISAFDPYLAPDDSAWDLVERLGFGELLGSCDALSLHVPLTSDTRHLINELAIARMPVGSVLVNTSRGGIVDETALVAALRAGRLAGAALDVFETEPLDEVSGKRLADVPGLVLTPHIAGLTAESNHRVSSVTAQNVRRVLEEG